ncbi:MAG: hypothetical protein ACR2PS_06650 [Pseudomonadales bacterium]
MKYSSKCRSNRKIVALVNPLVKPGLTQSLALLAAAFAVSLPTAANYTVGDRACSTSAHRMSRACMFDIADDYWVNRANCANILDPDERAECRREGAEELGDGWRLCGAQLRARRELCGQLGEQAYDVSDFWKAENFVNPLEIGVSVPANPYFELVPGSRSFGDEDEGNTVTVTQETKLIAGVTCVVVQDVEQEEGAVLENTDDWYAQDIEGNVWYCGEISENFELFEGDDPADPELVDVDGSWKAFRDSAQPGILMKATPQIGDVYRQEMAIEDAEDVAEVLQNTADGLLEGDECNEDGDDVEEYIDSVCNGNCLITKEFSPIEPGVVEHKYYAPGIGLILEIKVEDIDDEEDVGSCTVPEGVIDDDDDDDDEDDE